MLWLLLVVIVVVVVVITVVMLKATSSSPGPQSQSQTHAPPPSSSSTAPSPSPSPGRRSNADADDSNDTGTSGSDDKSAVVHKMSMGEYKLSLDDKFCVILGGRFDNLLSCDQDEGGRRFTFVENGDGFNIYTNENSCLLHDTTHPDAQFIQRGIVKCNRSRDTPGQMFKAVDYIPGTKKFKMLDATNNKYCRTAVPTIGSKYVRCDLDNVEDAGIFRLHS